MSKKKQWRDIETEKLLLELIQLSHIRRSEKVAGRLLLAACVRAEERTRPTEHQKPAYKGIEFSFLSPLEMAIYIITELPKEWEYCKELKIAWQQAKGKQAKKLVVPTIDRINESKHYERGNIQILTNEDNRNKSIKGKMQPRAFLVHDENGFGLVSRESITATANAMNTKNHSVAKNHSFSYTRLEPTATEEEYKAQCELHGIIYEPPAIRAERAERMMKQVKSEKLDAKLS